uniref:Uncharacterized protein n=1 Tax=Magallana gigas TaxID=29159 RepID=K1QY13_MAGGI
MKTVFILAVVLVAVYAETCSRLGDCTTTTCSGGAELHCVDSQCTCTTAAGGTVVLSYGKIGVLKFKEDLHGVMLRIYLFLLLFMSTEETGQEIDLAFALNTPSVMSATDLSNAVDFIYYITERLTIGPSNTLVTAVTYSKTPTQHFNLTAYSSKEAVLSALATMKSANRSFEESNSNEVLDFFRTTGFRDSRTTSSKLVVLIMVKGPTSRTLTTWAAQDLFDVYNSTADTSIIEDCPDPYAIIDTTTPVYPTKDDSFPLVTIAVLIGFLFLLACIIIVYKVFKGNAKDAAVLRAIEVYGEARLGTSKGSFCLDELGSKQSAIKNSITITVYRIHCSEAIAGQKSR